MAENSKIQWTHHSWSPWIGCTKVSAGCTHCYADELMTRKPRWSNTWGPRGERVRTSEAYWRKPLAWNRQAEKEGVRYRVFPSLCDPFDEHESIPKEWRVDFYNLIDATPHLDWLLLTKRPEQVKPLLIEGERGFQHLPPNVWIGTSVEDQKTADTRIPALLDIPASIRFLSCEPLLGPINLLGNGDGAVWPWVEARMQGHGIDWVIIGGESGHKARPMNIEWVHAIIEQCQGASVPVFVKQLGARPYSDVREGPFEYYSLDGGSYEDGPFCAVLKDKKGGDIDEWPADLQIREFPEVQHA